ncbi:calcium-dependent protein kinase 3, partial [Plasmodium gaboni]
IDFHEFSEMMKLKF